MAGRPPGHPPGQGMFLRSESLGSARTLSFLRTPVESCYIDTYASSTTRTATSANIRMYVLDSDTPTRSTRCARRHNNYGHRYRAKPNLRGRNTQRVRARLRVPPRGGRVFFIFYIVSTSVHKRNDIPRENIYRIHREQHSWKFLTIAGIAVLHFELLEKQRIVPYSLLVHFAVRSSRNNVPIL